VKGIIPRYIPTVEHQVRGEVQALTRLGRGGEQSSNNVGDGSFLRLRTGGLQYISVREGPFLLVAVLGNEGQVDERRGGERSGRGVGTAVRGAPATLLTD